ncbi:CRISPR-associated DxTHG motif protein [Advenella sp.]
MTHGFNFFQKQALL